MKIVSGLGSLDEYIPFAEAGADEFFCGYVPFTWSKKYGTMQPLNRREVMNYNVQIGAFEELKILKKMVDCYGVPVKLALNSLYYTGEQYKEIAELVDACMQIGFDTFIIADPALILYLREQKISCKIHLSGECAEVNSLFLAQIAKFDIRRVIFHRKNSIAQMQACIVKCRGEIPEYEAFFLIELCHFTGAYGNSFHCDEFAHLCHVPYELGNVDGRQKRSLAAAEEISDVCAETEQEGYVTGATGCGLCALYDLKRAGVTHLKIVGRGNYAEYAKRDIMQARRALQILAAVESMEAGRAAEWAEQAGADMWTARYKKRVQTELFRGGCTKNCYYL